MRLPRRRSAYTLLEVLLAMAIGLLLMAALYTVLHMTLRHAQAGRDRVEQSTLARALITRIAGDITPNLPPPKPAQSGSSSGQGGGGSSSPSGSGATSSTGGTSQSGGSSPSSTSAPIQGLNGAVTFNYGIQGDSTHLILFVSRVTRELDPSYYGDAVPTVSDLRQITFWLSSYGLARQEIKLATSDDAQNALSLNLPDDPSLVIAEEVQSLNFQYFDGTNWQDSWDGTQTPSTGGNNAQGPPLAIAITIGLAVPGSSTESGEPKLKTYRQVIPIQTANGTTQNTISGTTSSSGTTSP